MLSSAVDAAKLRAHTFGARSATRKLLKVGMSTADRQLLTCARPQSCLTSAACLETLHTA